ncbi:hypothetical protein [Synechococcus sp. CCY9202]|uniref:hypothetical protein n=1 Tax=Synechococcus sp. CCY9202 TaxID=174698 RepID=UPI002B21C3B3|nr:hypothetical protein [Synechococcus sp. CCY9202]MEA5423737.1 hypothetical protein [Synechococcus sp. CCY9202]
MSGDARSTAERLVQLGVAPSRIAGDSCARTTWENATRAFARQGLQVHPLAAETPLTAPERNRLALREAAATLLYRLQGRM